MVRPVSGSSSTSKLSSSARPIGWLKRLLPRGKLRTWCASQSPSDSQASLGVLAGREATLTSSLSSIKENAMATLRSKLVTVAAVGAAAVGGAGIANAASSAATSSPASATPAAAQQHSGGRHTANGKTEQALTGDVASKVKAAALA